MRDNKVNQSLQFSQEKNSRILFDDFVVSQMLQRDALCSIRV